MNLPAGTLRVNCSRSPKRKSIKIHTLTDAELLNILDNHKWMSSDEEFDECLNDSDGDDGENEGDNLQILL